MAAHGVSFDTDAYLMESELESPAGEEDIHNSFSELIEEQCHILNNDAEDIEMYPLEPADENLDEFSSFMAANEDNVPTDPQTGECWSTETLRILSSMPSRTIGRSRGEILSQYYNRTMQLCRRRHSMHPTIRSSSRSARPSICGYRVETDVVVFDREESKREQLVNNLQNLSISERVRMLKAIPLNLTEKSELRRLALNKTGRSSNLDKVPCCSRFKDSIFIVFRHGWYSWLSFLSSLQLWQTPLKKVSGRFGTGVLSYFVFLRTLFFFNIFLFFVTGLFLVIPQAVRPRNSTVSGDHYYGLEVLIGTGYFKESLLYYGYYSNSILMQNHSGNHSLGYFSYNMPLAYFFTIGMAFFITCIILVYSMSKSFGQSFRINRSKGLLAVKVFCSWDFKVSKKSSVKVQSENICTQLRELVAEVNQEKVKSTCRQCMSTVAIQVLAWTICIGSTVVCSLAVYYFSEHMNKDRQKNTTTNKPMLQEASLLALPVVVSSINLLLPGFFNGVAWMEEYDSPWKRNYVAIFRNLMLKVSLLAVLCYHWLGRVAQTEPKKNGECWESFVGQEVYRFLLMDFIFTMLDTFFGEFLWRVFTQKVLKKDRKPVFDIARNVLELIYGQTLAWLGVLFTPLLPAVQVIKLFMLFYIKKTSLMMNCQAPRKPWRASQMTTFFLTLLCFPSFLGAAVCVTYTMWTIKPSADCGPFQGLNSMFQAGKRWVENLAQTHPHLSWMVFVHTYLVENPVFLFIAAGIFLIVIYFHSQVVDGQRKIIELLQEQIENEGDDKKFLITRLQNLHEQKRPFSSRHSRRNVEGSSVS